MKRESLIEVKSVSKIYESKKLRVLNLLSFDVHESEFLSIVGPSGCGKTTLLEILAGIEAPTSGTVLFRGKPIIEARSKKRIGFVPQTYNLLPWLNVIDNIVLPLRISGIAPPDARKKAEDLVTRFKLSGFENYYPDEISGGMQQRAALARAVIYDPAVLLMDEPFGALDEPTRNSMNQFLLNLWHETGKTVVFVTHNITEAVYLSDRVLVLSMLTNDKPTEIVRTIEIDLPRPRIPDLKKNERYFRLVEHVGNW